MERALRDMHDRLVNNRLSFIAYGIVVITQAAVGFFVYAVIMAYNGWMPTRLLFIKVWENKYNNALEDNWTQEWSSGQMMMLHQNSIMLTNSPHQDLLVYCYIISIFIINIIVIIENIHSYVK